MRTYLLLLLLVLSACSTPSLLLKRGIHPEPLHVFMEFHPTIPQEVQDELSRKLDDAILAHNASTVKLHIEREEIRAYKNTLRIQVHTTKLIGGKENAAGIALSALGLSMPILLAAGGSEFIFGFCYFPQTTSLLEFQLSPDIDDSPRSSLIIPHKTAGFLKSRKKQIMKQGYSFQVVMKKIFKTMEKRMD